MGLIGVTQFQGKLTGNLPLLASTRNGHLLGMPVIPLEGHQGNPRLIEQNSLIRRHPAINHYRQVIAKIGDELGDIVAGTPFIRITSYPILLER
jgi:hypothetical protein